MLLWHELSDLEENIHELEKTMALGRVSCMLEAEGSEELPYIREVQDEQLVQVYNRLLNSFSVVWAAARQLTNDTPEMPAAPVEREDEELDEYAAIYLNPETWVPTCTWDI